MTKNYEEYIAELESELSDAKQSNEAKNAQIQALAAERDRYRDDCAVLDRLMGHRNRQDAIAAWSMGFE